MVRAIRAQTKKAIDLVSFLQQFTRSSTNDSFINQ